jgi:hypothetical protein
MRLPPLIAFEIALRAGFPILSVDQLFCSGGAGCGWLCRAEVEDHARGNVSMFESFENIVDRR